MLYLCISLANSLNYLNPVICKIAISSFLAFKWIWLALCVVSRLREWFLLPTLGYNQMLLCLLFQWRRWEILDYPSKWCIWWWLGKFQGPSGTAEIEVGNWSRGWFLGREIVPYDQQCLEKQWSGLCSWGRVIILFWEEIVAFGHWDLLSFHSW